MAREDRACDRADLLAVKFFHKVDCGAQRRCRACCARPIAPLEPHPVAADTADRNALDIRRATV